MKVLIVDDKEDMRRLIRHAIGPLFDVIEAGSGRQALRLVRREKPRLVLLDVVMPGMDGIAVLRSVRKIDPAIRVIMVSADCSMDVARAVFAHEDISYFTKPFDPDSLYGEVYRVLVGPV